ncbi:MAG: hypothetical protein RR816_00360, partial [Clostridia bacterium]
GEQGFTLHLTRALPLTRFSSLLGLLDVRGIALRAVRSLAPLSCGLRRAGFHPAPDKGFALDPFF